MFAGRHLRGEDAEGENVGARIHRAAAELFGRHVAGGSRRRPCLRQARRGRPQCIVDRAREAKIEDLHPSISAADDVFRF